MCSETQHQQEIDNTNNTASPPTTTTAATVDNAELIIDRRPCEVLEPEPPVSVPASNGTVSNSLIKAENPVARASPAMDAVVKVFCFHSKPNFSLPWQRNRQNSSTSSGFIIKGRRVLTNAHSVEHYTQVKLKKRGSDTKYVATVLAIGEECDIALLTVEDEEFWEGVSPVQFGDLPELQDAVTVVGYPIGGDTISVTSGVVSRIGILSYVHGSADLLGLQIDAAINSGNSGGPAFSDKKTCVGIAFQSLKNEDVENIGYVIPTPVIMHFIQDYEKNGRYTGFLLGPSLIFLGLFLVRYAIFEGSCGYTFSYRILLSCLLRDFGK